MASQGQPSPCHLWRKEDGIQTKNESYPEKMSPLIFALKEDWNQLAYPRSFGEHMKKLYILGYSNCAQWRFWSDCANAQADLNLRWAHMSEGDIAAYVIFEEGRTEFKLNTKHPCDKNGFMRRLIWITNEYTRQKENFFHVTTQLL